MVWLKNSRPSVLFIADAGLRLAPGEKVERAELTPQIEVALSRKQLIQIHEKESQPAKLNKQATKKKGRATGREAVLAAMNARLEEAERDDG